MKICKLPIRWPTTKPKSTRPDTATIHFRPMDEVKKEAMAFKIEAFGRDLQQRLAVAAGSRVWKFLRAHPQCHDRTRDYRPQMQIDRRVDDVLAFRAGIEPQLARLSL